MLAAVMVAAFPVGAARAAPLHLGEGRPTRAAPTQSTWLDVFIELLRLIYIVLGGNPTDVTNAPDAEAAMATVTAYWTAHGLPSGLTTAQEQALVGDIDSASTHLNSAPSDVNPAAVLAFRGTLSVIRALVYVPDGP